ncbi:MAG: 50S ribosome-binding GTPase [Alphaproteobacteria bacterium]|nr:50S ribosome-binding GTPase [Alphaproteobacteria bacterium]
MIIATAGHVDHGKTSLVAALTGVDTDRLAEEKRRGLTIDLGYAWLDLPSGQRAGFIDVPGHERFVRNMVSGLARVDLGLLAVAADDGVMPQTIEHVVVLSLLGIRQMVIAVTKADRSTDERIACVAGEAQALRCQGRDRHVRVRPERPGRTASPSRRGDAVRGRTADGRRIPACCRSIVHHEGRRAGGDRDCLCRGGMHRRRSHRAACRPRHSGAGASRPGPTGRTGHHGRTSRHQPRRAQPRRSPPRGLDRDAGHPDAVAPDRRDGVDP